MRKPIIAIRLYPRNYAGLVSLGRGIIGGLTGNASFASPAVPLVDLQTAIDEVVDALAQWGPVGNRGKHESVIHLRQKALLLADMLKAEAQYVQTKAHLLCGLDYATMAVIMNSSGFALANVPAPQGVLEKVQNLHESVTRKLNKNQGKLRWSKPLNVTSRSNVKEYKILRSNDTDFTNAVEVGVSTKTLFIDVNTSRSSVRWTYWIVPYNSKGAGVASDAITVNLLGL